MSRYRGSSNSNWRQSSDAYHTGDNQEQEYLNSQAGYYGYDTSAQDYYQDPPRNNYEDAYATTADYTILAANESTGDYYGYENGGGAYYQRQDYHQESAQESNVQGYSRWLGQSGSSAYNDSYNSSYNGRYSQPSPRAQQRAYHSDVPHVVAPILGSKFRKTPTPAPASSPPPVPTPTAPSAEYLAISQQPSTPTPAAPRKLLILDLNGTLLIRAAHTASHPPGHPRKLRAVHPRPYMPAFHAYLRAPATRAWLDTMVWSSAQPHSVQDMVARCFPPDKGEVGNGLVAVWARDTLGLSNNDYHRKSRTTKDLAKPWAQLPLSASLAASNTTPLSDSSPPSSPPGLTTSSDPPPAITEDAERHSARTTLLLDDSPLKAHLQPWNHVCVREYDAELRARDLKRITAEAAQAKAAAAQAEAEADAERVKVTNAEDASTEGDAGDDAEGENNKKAKKSKKRARAATESPDPDEAEGEAYDATLLAVIGILDTLKAESNVAGWIRAGGLWGPAGPPPDAGVDDDDLAVRSSEEAEKVEDEVKPGEALTERQLRRKAKKRRKRGGDAGLGADDSAPGLAGAGAASASASASASGNDAEEGVPGLPSIVAEPAAKAPPMWFDNAMTMDCWIARGRRALEELGIETAHGVDR